MNDFEVKDIHKIIDDAMEKKDREVTIFISKDHTHITVSPREDTKPRWIFHPNHVRALKFECSECGAFYSDVSPFCSQCGEKLAGPDLKGAKDDEKYTSSTET